nr:2'-deoxycytidine 5'-triphosphate deaminase [Rhodopseudomonas sp. WA056]
MWVAKFGRQKANVRRSRRSTLRVGKGARRCAPRGAFNLIKRDDGGHALLCPPHGLLYGQRIGSNYQAQGLKLSKHFKA